MKHNISHPTCFIRMVIDEKEIEYIDNHINYINQVIKRHYEIINSRYQIINALCRCRGVKCLQGQVIDNIPIIKLQEADLQDKKIIITAVHDMNKIVDAIRKIEVNASVISLAELLEWEEEKIASIKSI